MCEIAKLILGSETYEFPIVVGTENERAIDIRPLRAQTGHITLDSGFMNTGSCESEITFINGEKGILRYRGIPLDQLADQSSFIETSYLLLNGNLPSPTELSKITQDIANQGEIPEQMKKMLQHFPQDAHPMAVLGSMINALAGFYQEVVPGSNEDVISEATSRLIAVTSTIAAHSYKHSIGEEFVAPSSEPGYSENFLKMMFSSPDREYSPDPDMVKALEMLLIMHADHEQNCSASSVRLVGSSQPSLYAAITAGIAALWGPLHGGANQAVMEMLAQIHKSGKEPEAFIDMAKDKSNNFRLSGFGHRVYKNYDPRARIIKNICMDILKKESVSDPLLDIAVKLEAQVLNDDYFIKRKLYPNVDFYSGLLYKAMGIPTDMFTVLFAIGRMPGWIAQWKEMINTPGIKIGRPRQVYTGNNETNYIPMQERHI